MVLSCREKVTCGGCDNWVSFSTQKKYGGDYLRNFPFYKPDSVIKRLQTELPIEWCGKAVESVYYRLPANMPDYQVLAYLDKFDTAFPNDSVRAFTQMMRGHISIEHVQYDSARLFLNDAYVLSVKNNRLLRASDAQFNLARILVKQGNYPEGIRILLECYSLREPRNTNDGSLEEVMLALGQAYRFYEKYEDAQEWDSKLWQLSDTKIADKSVRARVAMSMATNYIHLSALDSAKIMIDTSFALVKGLKSDAYYNVRYFIRGEVNRAFGNCARATDDYWRAKRERPYLEDVMLLSRFNKGLADNYQCLGKTDSAIFFYKQALHTPDTVSQVKIYAELAHIYQQKNNLNEALAAERKSEQLKIRMITVDKERKLERIKVTKEDEARIAKAEYERQKSSFLLYGSVLLSLLLTSIAVFVIRYQRGKQRLLQTQNELAMVKAEVQAKAIVEQEAAITQTTALLALKNSLIENLQQRIQAQTDSQPPDLTADKALTRHREATEAKKNEPFNNLRILTNEDWITFRQQFDDRFPGFNLKLKTLFPKISAADTRLFLLLKIGFNNTQIAEALGISAASVYTSRYRLRKKLGLENTDESLPLFIHEF